MAACLKRPAWSLRADANAHTIIGVGPIHLGMCRGQERSLANCSCENYTQLAISVAGPSRWSSPKKEGVISMAADALNKCV
jgi:hypothetical protein